MPAFHSEAATGYGDALDPIFGFKRTQKVAITALVIRAVVRTVPTCSLYRMRDIRRQLALPVPLAARGVDWASRFDRDMAGVEKAEDAVAVDLGCTISQEKMLTRRQVGRLSRAIVGAWKPVACRPARVACSPLSASFSRR
jgi:hypothetical protein